MFVYVELLVKPMSSPQLDDWLYIAYPSTSHCIGLGACSSACCATSFPTASSCCATSHDPWPARTRGEALERHRRGLELVERAAAGAAAASPPTAAESAATALDAAAAAAAVASMPGTAGLVCGGVALHASGLRQDQAVGGG